MLTEDKIKEILNESDADINIGAIGINDNLSASGIDSLDLFTAFLRFEEETGVKVADEEVDGLNTINNILEFYNSRLQ